MRKSTFGESNIPRYNWRIATFIEGGERCKRYFKTKTEANEFKGQSESVALKVGTSEQISKIEGAAVLEYRLQLEELGLSVRDAPKLGIESRRRTQNSASVSELITDYIKAKEAEGSQALSSGSTIPLGSFWKGFWRAASLRYSP